MIWEPDDLPLVAPGATTTITARFDTAAESISGLQFEAADDGGNSQTANVTVTPTYYAARRPGGRELVGGAGAALSAAHPGRGVGGRAGD